MKCQILLSGKIKKNVINLLSASGDGYWINGFILIDKGY